MSPAERERRINIAAAAMTSPNAQPQTRRKMRQYARRAVDALAADEATGGTHPGDAPPPCRCLTHCRSGDTPDPGDDPDPGICKGLPRSSERRPHA